MNLRIVGQCTVYGHSNIKIRWFSGVLKNAERNCQRYHIAALLFVSLINNGYAIPK